MADNQHPPQSSYIPADDRQGIPRQQAPHMESRRIPPHGDVSPKGDRVWPRPSMTAKVLVYGGTALAAAAATAAGVLAVRKVVDLVSGQDELDREADRAAERARAQVYGSAPRFAAMPDAERDQMRRRASARMQEDAAVRRRLREQARAAQDAAPRSRPARATQPKRQGLMEEIESNARRATRTIDDVVGAVTAAVAGFRSVAGQTDSMIREFGGAADRLRSFFDRGPDSPDARGQRRDAGGPVRGTARDDGSEAVDDPRIHRL